MKPEAKSMEDRQASILEEMTEYICKEVSSAELVSIDAFWDEYAETMLLTLFFSIGTNRYQATIDWSGVIHNYSPKTPKHLLVDIHNGICGGYLKGIMREASQGKEV